MSLFSARLLNRKGSGRKNKIAVAEQVTELANNVAILLSPQHCGGGEEN